MKRKPDGEAKKKNKKIVALVRLIVRWMEHASRIEDESSSSGILYELTQHMSNESKYSEWRRHIKKIEHTLHREANSYMHFHSIYTEETYTNSSRARYRAREIFTNWLVRVCMSVYSTPKFVCTWKNMENIHTSNIFTHTNTYCTLQLIRRYIFTNLLPSALVDFLR